jgi:hypothetical protein
MWGFSFDDLARRAQEEAAKLAVSTLFIVTARPLVVERVVISEMSKIDYRIC